MITNLAEIDRINDGINMQFMKLMDLYTSSIDEIEKERKKEVDNISIDINKVHFILNRLYELNSFGVYFEDNNFNKIENLASYILLLDEDNLIKYFSDILYDKNYLRYNFDCGTTTHNSIFNKIGLPWNISIRDIILPYFKGNINESFINVIFENLHSTLPLVLSEVNKEKEKFQGTQKWQEYADKFLNNHIIPIIENIVTNNSLEKIIKVNSIEKTLGIFSDPYLKVKLTLSHKPITILKNKILHDCSEKLLLEYRKLNPNITSIYDAGTQLNFVDDNTLIIQIPSNSYKALALDEDAQFLPKLGKK